ncbi:unnamed protein product [Absidia cylindrospora]
MTSTALIHDPLLFYPYAQTHYERASYLSMTDNEKTAAAATTPDANSPITSSPSTSSMSSMSSIPNCNNDDIDWKQVMSSIKKAMYNTTGAVVPSPVTYICKDTSFAPEPSKDPAFFYNSDILDVKDMYSYRQLRSENLLYRMFNCPRFAMDVDQTSVMRLAKGVFVANKLQQSTPTSPVLTAQSFMDTPYLDVDASVDTIDTFHYGDMKRFMLQQQQQEQHLQQDFMPYSYTFGARYSNPYHGRDVVIRGNQLPLWCQTLFLNECINRMPLEPNVPYTGLFPFAPNFTVVFQTLSTDISSANYQPCYPDLTFVYERYAMEFSDPFSPVDADTDALWSKQKQQVVDEMLLCDIPEVSAEVLTQLANLWATDQGLNL